MSELSLNFDKATILDYKVGARKPEHFEGENFHNKEKGFAINTYRGLISSILICLKNGYEEFKQFQGTVIVFGAEYSFNDSTTQNEIESAFGVPDDFWNDGVEKCLEYNLGGFDIEAVWNVEGDEYLKYLSIER